MGFRGGEKSRGQLVPIRGCALLSFPAFFPFSFNNLEREKRKGGDSGTGKNRAKVGKNGALLGMGSPQKSKT
jgi:hypothetical protein